MYVSVWSDTGSQVFVFSKEGKLVTSFGRLGYKEGEFICPSGLVFDVDGFLYVCDYGNSRLLDTINFFVVICVYFCGLE